MGKFTDPGAGRLRGEKMRRKRAAAVCMAAFLFAGIIPAAQGSTWAKEQDNHLKVVGEMKQQGKYLKEMVTDRSMYNPGENVKVTVTLENPRGNAWSASATFILRHLDQEVWREQAEVEMSAGHFELSVPTPEKDFTGYSLESYLYDGETLLDYSMTGVDVSSDWNVFPRYGYVTKMEQSTEDVRKTLERLKNHHINGLFYYDVFDTQEKPLAGSAEEPAESWNTLNRSVAKKQTVLDTINLGHEMNMKSFFYNLIFGVYDNYEAAGVSPEWGMYKDERHQQQDAHDISGIGWETEKFWLMNPANRLWQDYYIKAHQELFSVYPYDGIQVDSLGHRGDVFDYEGNAIALDNAYVPMLNRLVKELNRKVIFNPVSSYGMEPQLKAVDYDIVYVEVWPHDVPDFATMKQTVDNIYKSTQGKKGTVIAAYMNYDAPKSENFNIPSINYINAVLMSAGAGHLELGDTGMLSSEYYPGNSMRISSRLEKDISNQYSFQVAYENLLRGTGLSEVSDNTWLSGVKTASDLKPGKVTSFTKVKKQEGEPDREILHLLNFDGASHDSWVDKGLAQTAPTIKENQAVSHVCTFVPEKVWVASPDNREGILQEVEFTVENNTVVFTLPYLEYYTMVVME